MRLALSFGGLLCGLFGIGTLFLSKSAIHEGVAALIVLIGSTMFIGGALLGGIGGVKSSIAALHEEVIALRRALEKLTHP